MPRMVKSSPPLSPLGKKRKISEMAVESEKEDKKLEAAMQSPPLPPAAKNSERAAELPDESEEWKDWAVENDAKLVAGMCKRTKPFWNNFSAKEFDGKISGKRLCQRWSKIAPAYTEAYTAMWASDTNMDIFSCGSTAGSSSTGRSDPTPDTNMDISPSDTTAGSSSVGRGEPGGEPMSISSPSASTGGGAPMSISPSVSTGTAD